MTSKILARAVFAAALAAAAAAVPARVSAHHAIQAEFDLAKTGSFKGKLTRFALINPHVRWFFEETKPDGKVVKWEMTGAGPGALRAAGLVRMFETGKMYDVTFAPAHNGGTVGRVRTMKGEDGKVVTLFHEDPNNPLNN